MILEDICGQLNSSEKSPANDSMKNSQRSKQYIYIGLECRVFANGPGDLGSIPDLVIQKTQEMVLDTSLLNAQY